MIRGTKTFIAAAIAASSMLVATQSAFAAPNTITAVNALEAGVLTEMNSIRVRHGLPRLRMSMRLSAAADVHSLRMGQNGFFTHESRDGSAFWKRVQKFYGWNGYKMWSVGENLLWSSPGVDPVGAVKMWMDSPGHRANVLSKRWREVGLSAVFVPAAPGVFGGQDVTIVTADFGIRR